MLFSARSTRRAVSVTVHSLHLLCLFVSPRRASARFVRVWAVAGAALAPLVVFSDVPAAQTAAISVPAAPYEITGPAVPRGRIDELVFADLAALGLAPAAPCNDAVFVRRVFLDVIGTLPTADEARAFLADRAPNKRAALIDQLLARDEFDDYWAMKWSDLLRVKAEFPINLWPNAAQCYHRWIRDAVHDAMPLDRFARELLTANGSNFRVGPANFWRAAANRQPAGLARVVALTFLSSRVESWPAGRLDAFAPFFAQLAWKGTQEWKEEIVFFDPALARPATAPHFPDGTPVVVPGDTDPRTVFADWLLRADNPVFARSLANRAWAWLLGRGIVHPADDLRPDNPPVNPELLDHLAQALVAASYDQRALFREILNSQTYQLSSLAPTDDPRAETHFAFYAPRRLDAEVLIDALNQITGTTESYTSAIPEPFTFIPAEQRAIALPDGSITSAFLEKFGRPSRDTGEEAERNNALTAAQRLHLLNSTHLQRKLEQGPALAALLHRKQPVDELYLSLLSRPPTASERETVAAYIRTHAPARRAGLDVAWALLNSDEFLLRH
jgi:hypothetical protein